MPTAELLNLINNWHYNVWWNWKQNWSSESFLQGKCKKLNFKIDFRYVILSNKNFCIEIDIDTKMVIMKYTIKQRNSYFRLLAVHHKYCVMNITWILLTKDMLWIFLLQDIQTSWWNNNANRIRIPLLLSILWHMGI